MLNMINYFYSCFDWLRVIFGITIHFVSSCKVIYIILNCNTCIKIQLFGVVFLSILNVFDTDSLDKRY